MFLKLKGSEIKIEAPKIELRRAESIFFLSFFFVNSRLDRVHLRRYHEYSEREILRLVFIPCLFFFCNRNYEL